MTHPPAQGTPLHSPTPPVAGTAWEVLWVFLRLGLTSFGGPVAHLGYFRTEFVERRRWVDERGYSDLVALCQFLPGPASSQVGMALGLQRAGWTGALAAWVGFTLPSAIALILFAHGVTNHPAIAASGAVQGLKIVAVAVVAQAVWGMARTLCPDVPRASIAAGAALWASLMSTSAGQLLALTFGALMGWAFLKGTQKPPVALQGGRVGRRTGAWLLLLCAAGLGLLPVAAVWLDTPWWQATSVFYQAGALVFGGGHVVLPLLQAGVVHPGWVSDEVFLAGYGAVQAVPGPLFTFAAYLGAVMPAPLGGWAGGLTMLAVIFVPAFLLVAGALPYWEGLRQRDTAQRAMGGINAAVVGLLAAALYDPVWTTAIHAWPDAAWALVAFVLLVLARLSPLWVAALAAIVGAVVG